MSILPRFTSADLDLLPEDDKRYELIEGDLLVTHQPHWNHQFVCNRLGRYLDIWSEGSGLGEVNAAPGIILAEDEDVAPDLVWISNERLQTALQGDGKLHQVPELVVEVLSPGSRNELRDRQLKRKLYARRGVYEYWIVDWEAQQIEVYRRQDATLELMATLFSADTLASPLLPGFGIPVGALWRKKRGTDATTSP
ncbi:MAG: Uma2 family endonuclease [Synechococcales cyanobacterium]